MGRSNEVVFKKLHAEYDRTYSDLVNYACENYGDRGPLVSGIVHEHFPTWVKDRLRFLSTATNVSSDARQVHEFLSKTRSPSFT